ncbi:MAG TPA: alpha/beta fold hydrolase, partial [Paracoccaceae bacterium]|nr:alpha/beta fold hydrolase [Paracoccaceae bacterium]
MTKIPGFTRNSLPGDGVRLSVQRAGAGAPLVLLHGFPQTGLCWWRVAPVLARDFDVIVPDLRGYGLSVAPPDDDGHTTYSKRQMARDVVAVLDSLGLQRARVLGHDRGARGAHRLAPGHPGGGGRPG